MTINPEKSFIREFFPIFKKYRHELLWVSIGQIFVFISSFAGIKILTSKLGPAGYGEFALGLSLAALTQLLLFAPIEQYMLRFFSIFKERGKLSDFFLFRRRIYGVMILPFLFLGTITLACFFYFGGFVWGELALLGIILGATTSGRSYYAVIQSAARLRKTVAFLASADSSIRPLFAIGFILLVGKTSHMAMIGYCLAAMATALVQRRLFNKYFGGTDLSKGIQENDKNEFYSFAGPFFLWAWLGAASLYGDRWILQGVVGIKAVGIYAALYQIANAPIVLLSSILSQLMIPIIYDRAGTLSKAHQFTDSSRSLTLTIVCFCVPLLAFLFVVARLDVFFVKFLTSPEFVDAANNLPVIVIGLVLFNIGQLLTIKGTYFNRPKIYIGPKIFHAIITPVLTFLLARYAGIAGVAIALSCSSALYCIYIVIVNRNLSRVDIQGIDIDWRTNGFEYEVERTD